eukprot:8951718-Alexandrium_andersonii.AAC.1
MEWGQTHQNAGQRMLAVQGAAPRGNWHNAGAYMFERVSCKCNCASSRAEACECGEHGSKHTAR